MGTIWESLESEFMARFTAYLYFMSTERAKRFRDINTIPTVWTFLICDKAFEDILWRVEPFLYTENEESEYRDDDKWPEKLDEIKER